MKIKMTKVLAILISALVVFASCGLDGRGNITINLPPIESRARAIAAERLDDLKTATTSYRVTVEANGQRTEKSGKDRSYSFSVPVGAVATITLECLNADGKVIVRAQKTITVYAGINNVDIKLSRDGEEIVNIWMSDHEVTQKEWKDVMQNNGNGTTTPQNSSTDYGKGDDYPMYYVNWYDALVYCNKRSMQEDLTPCYTINGKTNPDEWGTVPTAKDTDWDAVTCDFNANGYRLPTEAEWEYMAKGGEYYTYSGSDNIEDVAWYTTNSGSKTHEVKGKNPNKYGMYDMSGNVYEWCWDWYTSGSSRVNRGGCWRNNAANCAVSYRNSSTPDYRYYGIGFRVVRSQ